jgi:hypothetical protein
MLRRPESEWGFHNNSHKAAHCRCWMFLQTGYILDKRRASQCASACAELTLRKPGRSTASAWILELSIQRKWFRLHDSVSDLPLMSVQIYCRGRVVANSEVSPSWFTGSLSRLKLNSRLFQRLRRLNERPLRITASHPQPFASTSAIGRSRKEPRRGVCRFRLR